MSNSKIIKKFFLYKNARKLATKLTLQTQTRTYSVIVIKGIRGYGVVERNQL